MPILDVEMVTDDRSNSETWAKQIADAAGTAFRTGEGTVWVKLRFVSPANYAENHVPGYSTPRPVFVSILCRDLPPEAEKQVLMRGLADRIGEILQIPAPWVHILFQPPARGRIGFGGEWLE